MRDNVRGAIVGVAIGDALGMPVESLHPQTIKKYFKWVKTYRSPNLKTRTFHKLKRGQWTDDTQLTLAIGESIINNKKVDFNDIAKRHVDVFLNGRRGWGRATSNSIQRIVDGTNWWDAGEPNAAGNGPPMKIAPIGVLYGLDVISKIELVTICTNISKMTHNDPRAIVGAIIQAYLVGITLKYGKCCLEREIPRVWRLADAIEGLEAISKHECTCATHDVAESILLKLKGK